MEKSNETLTKAIGLYNVLIKKKVPLQSIVYINAGATANQLSDYKQAIEYFSLALEKAEETKDEASKAGALNFMGVTYYMQRDIDKAIKRIESSIAISKNNGIDRELIVSYRLLEEIYQSLGIPSKVNEAQVILRELEKAERNKIAEKKQDITRSDLDASSFESELLKLSADKQRDKAAAEVARLENEKKNSELEQIARESRLENERLLREERIKELLVQRLRLYNTESETRAKQAVIEAKNSELEKERANLEKKISDQTANEATLLLIEAEREKDQLKLKEEVARK